MAVIEGDSVGLLRRVSGAVLVGAAAVFAGLVGVGPAAAAPPPPTEPGMFLPTDPFTALEQTVSGGVEFSAVVTARSGRPAVPAAAVVLDVTISAATANGVAVFYPRGSARPATSNLNFTAGTPVRNQVVTALPASGSVAGFLNTNGHATVRIAVVGYYTPGTPADAGAFVAVPATRLLDTRSGLGAPAGAVHGGGAVDLQITGRGGVPAAGVGAVLLNVTATGPTAPGFVTVFPAGAAVPGTSNLSFATGQTLPNLVLAQVSADGRVTLRVGGTNGTVQLIADVAGYVLAGSPIEIDSLVTVPARRWVDSRSGLESPPGPLPVGSGSFPEVATGGVPRDASSIVLNVTVTQPTGAGTIGIATDSSSSNVMSLPYVRGQTIAGQAVVPISDTGQVAISINGTGTNTVQVIVDIQGYYLGRPRTVQGWELPRPPAGDFTTPSVSCVTTTFCAAVSAGGRAAVFDGSSWSPPVTADQPGNQARNMSCPTSTFCMFARGVAGAPGQVVTYDGTSWSGPAQALPDRIRTLSCASPSFCVAVSSSSRFSVFDGSGWSAPGNLPGAVSVSSVSCAATGHCVAVGGGTSETPGPGAIWTLDAGTWSTPVHPTQAGIGGVSCPTTASCTAVTSDNAILVLEHGAWTGPVPVPVRAGSGGLLLSCGTASLCLATDTVGNYFEIHRRAISKPLELINTPVVSISCTAADICMALTDTGRTLVSHN